MRFERPTRVWCAILLSVVLLALWAEASWAAPLPAGPTLVAPSLTLGALRADLTLHEMQVAVQNSGSVPIPAGAVWKLWRRASPTATGRTLAASGALPAVAVGDSYTLTVANVDNSGSYRFQVVWGQGKQAQVAWSSELSYNPQALATPAPSVTRTVTAPAAQTPIASRTATASQSATAVARQALTATATPHTALLPMIAGPGATSAVSPTASPSASIKAPTHVVNVPILGGPAAAQPSQPRWTLALLGLLAVLGLVAVVGAITYLSQPGGEPNILPPMDEPGPDDAPAEDED